jgi:hypothetical protein
VGLNGSNTFTHLSVQLPGMKETVLQIPQLQMDGIQSQSDQMQEIVEIPLPNYSLYKKRITKVYQRRQKKKEKTEIGPAVFGEVGEDYLPVGQNPDSPSFSSKRKATPVSVANLRRSKRNSSNKGFKPSTPVTPRSKKKQQKSPGKLHKSKPHLPFFCLSDFPDLAEVDRIIASGYKASAIPVDQLQKVAMERCGVPKEQVAVETLLATEEGDNPGKEGETLRIKDQ